MAPLPLLLLATTLLFTTPLAHSLDALSPAPALPLALVNLTISNNLLNDLNVTIPAGPLGTTRSVLIPPGQTGILPVESQSALLSNLVLRVLGVEYAVQGDLLQRTIARAATGTGLARIVVSSPCEEGEAYLSGLALASSVQVRVAFVVISVPVGTGCARPVSG